MMPETYKLTHMNDLESAQVTYAIELAAGVHHEQKDKAGAPYILHALEVMRMVAPDPELMVVGVLHDTFEDHPGTEMDKGKFRHTVTCAFSRQVFDALLALTHIPSEPYVNYIERVANNYLARVVKIADLTHNMDPRRIPASQIVDKDFARWDKYRRSLIRLERG